MMIPEFAVKDKHVKISFYEKNRIPESKNVKLNTVISVRFMNAALRKFVSDNVSIEVVVVCA